MYLTRSRLRYSHANRLGDAVLQDCMGMTVPVPSTISMVADGFVMLPMSTGGLSSADRTCPQYWETSPCPIGGVAALIRKRVVAVTSIRAQLTLFVARPVPAVS